MGWNGGSLPASAGGQWPVTTRNEWHFNAEPRLILYAQPGYRGAARVMQDEIRNIGAFGNRAASVEVRGGTWELCDREGWRGNCVTVDQDIPDLSRLGLTGAIVSARPIYDRF